jgi:hypothetical protein
MKLNAELEIQHITRNVVLTSRRTRMPDLNPFEKKYLAAAQVLSNVILFSTLHSLSLISTLSLIAVLISLNTLSLSR